MCSSISFSQNMFFEVPCKVVNRACFGGYPLHCTSRKSSLFALTLVTGFFWHPGADTWLPSPSPASRPYASSHGHFSNFNCCICNVDDWVALLCPAQPLHPQYKGKSSKQANLDVSCEGAALLRAAPSHWTRRERFKEGKYE